MIMILLISMIVRIIIIIIIIIIITMVIIIIIIITIITIIVILNIIIIMFTIVIIIIITTIIIIILLQANFKIQAAKIQYDVYSLLQRLRVNKMRSEHEEKVKVAWDKALVFLFGTNKAGFFVCDFFSFVVAVSSYFSRLRTARND